MFDDAEEITLLPVGDLVLEVPADDKVGSLSPITYTVIA